MRFADIILDLAAVAKASRSVTSRHLDLRARQIDRYSQTSSIIRSLRDDKSSTQGNCDPTSTASANDATNKGLEELTHNEASLQSDSTSGKNPNTKTSIISEGISSDPDSKAYQSIFQRRSTLADAAAQQPTALRPDQSAILAQLREKANSNSQNYAELGLGQAKNVQEEVPSGININVFHTSRGSQMLDGQEAALGQLRPKVPLTKPSWFKDFGHDAPKALREQHGGKPLPTISKTSGSGVSPVEQSAAAADVAIASPQRGELPNPPMEKKLIPSLSLNTDLSPDTARRETTTRPPENHISSFQETNGRQIERENTETVKEILSRGGLDKKDQEIPIQSLHEEPPSPVHALRESKVPATRLGRIWNYGGLAAGMLGGALTEGLSRGFGGGGQGSIMFSAGNMERLVAKLSRMRGAALKLGQMMSFQDSKMLPEPIREVLQRVQDRADYMPARQRDRVLTASLGSEWRDLFKEFEETPIAAASIGQVHRATLKTGEKVAVKIQFPGVADSINSDLDNISMLLMASGMLPKGLYLNKTIDNMRTELGWECDYERELECGKRYKELLADEGDVFAVPEIYARASGKHVLTMQFMEGVGVTRVKSFTQAQRDWIGTQILRLCLREIIEFHFMQTDPNWTNFLYNAATNKLELLDFGASREFPVLFVSQYVSLLAAAARRDRDAVIDYSQRLGYLTGHESRIMLDAHVASILTLAEPFLQSAPVVYDFSDQTITERVRDLIPVMMRERLTPPPEETYSLHRKLSGAFLLCARLGSRVKCRELFETALEKADFEDAQK
ncbi:ABC1 family-domain-containing protein [Xylaria bambusicola]|uniref:ABC1 family-domain-containing protein n=1 Tax=Xylaria bambusicola TaxID=326684 RepID=UPI002008CFE8|nr:ABC1 family-domain-containing protein [Xylaria bambusicola]KAI0525662.1 ABC1 family-domain-containing protein [Xylaria bambusicola]